MFVTSLRCMAAATVAVLIALAAPAVEARPPTSLHRSMKRPRRQ